MLSCGRVRNEIGDGLTEIINTELVNLNMSTLKIDSEQTISFITKDQEFTIVLIQGECEIKLQSGDGGLLGPRNNPFKDMPYAMLVTIDENVSITAKKPSFLVIGNSPSQKKMENKIISPKEVSKAIRGTENWKREVRKIIWSDNTRGNQLIVGETCTFSGNCSTVPPHRHQYDIPGQEVPYEEIYFFQFSHPKGRGLIWQFDEETGFDQAFSLKTNDAVYMNGGYHPVVCMPGSTLYHLTLMAGPHRISQASIHPDYQYLLDEKNIFNQYTPTNNQ